MKVVWPKRTLGSICEFVRGPFGGSLKKSEFVSDGFAVYEQQHAIYNQFESIRYFITDSKFKEMQRFELCPNDLIMSCSGTMGRVAIVPNHIRKGIINQALLKLTPSNAVLPEFLKYWMDSAVFQTSLIEQSGGAAIQNVASVRILKDINIFLPPLSEQQRIVAILDEAFEAIAAARANAEQSRQNAQALFESYLQSVFSQRGEGWVDTTIAAATGGVFTGPFGSLLHKRDYIEHGIPLVNPAHITSVGIEPDLRKTVSEETAQRLSNYIMRAGDIVIGRRGEMGRCAIVTDIEDGWLCGTGSFVIKPSERCDARYLVRLLRSESCKTQLENIAGGAVMPNLSNTDLSNFPIILPPIEMQRSVLRKIDLMAEKTQHLEAIYQRKIAALDELKQSLLQQAFNGSL
ncbi:restriction endonuclease subunit S [Aeromonas veronii]